MAKKIQLKIGREVASQGKSSSEFSFLRMIFLGVIFFGFGVSRLDGAPAAPSPSSVSVTSSESSQSCVVLFSPGALAASSIGKFLFLTPEEYFSDYISWANGLGCKTFLLKVPQDAGIDVRAVWIEEQTKNILRSAPNNTKVWVITHSLGGLDWRYLLKKWSEGKSEEKPQFKINGLISLGVPHQGTLWADFVLQLIEKDLWEYRFIKSVFGYDLKALEFLKSLTTEGNKLIQKHLCEITEPNQADKNDCGMRGKWYFAELNCESECHWSLRFLNIWAKVRGFKGDTQQSLGLNEGGDGLVSLSSQNFGKNLGGFRLDHLSTVKPTERGREQRQKLMKAMQKVLFQ